MVLLLDKLIHRFKIDCTIAHGKSRASKSSYSLIFLQKEHFEEEMCGGLLCPLAKWAYHSSANPASPIVLWSTTYFELQPMHFFAFEGENASPYYREYFDDS